MKTFLKAISLCLALFVGASSAWGQASPNEEQALATAERSVARVSIIARTSTGGMRLASYGSGFVIAPGVVATNFHVVASLMDESGALRTDVFVVVTPTPGNGGDAMAAKLSWYNRTADLALLAVPQLSAPALAMTNTLPGKTDRVRALGYPGATDDMLNLTADEIIQPRAPYPTAGEIALFSDRAVGGSHVATIFHTADISRGNSGGPLVDACGRLIGVNTWAGGARVDQDGFVAASGGQFVATRVDSLASLLEDARVSYRVDDSICALGKVGYDPAVDDQLKSLSSKLSDAQAAAETARRDNEALIRETRETRALAARLAAAGAVAVAVALGALWFVTWRRGRSNRPDRQLLYDPPSVTPPTINTSDLREDVIGTTSLEPQAASPNSEVGAPAPTLIARPSTARRVLLWGVAAVAAVLLVLIIASTLSWN